MSFSTGPPSDPSTFTFKNPIIPGFNPDPTICVVPATDDGTPATYFLSTSTFEYFPGCAIYTSTDLLNWRLIGHALNRRSQIEMRTVEPGAGSWASTLRYRVAEGRWYLANGIFQRYRPGSDERIFPRGFYVYTDNIWDDNAWSDPVYFDEPGFDQDLFWDDDKDKNVYLSTTRRLTHRPPNSSLKDFAIHTSEIDLATGRTLTSPTVIRQSPNGLAEGSHILKRGAWYYLFTAEGGTEAGHQEWVFRSRKGVYGPWEGQGAPLWYNGPGEEVQRTGHADVFEDGEGRWWAVLLGVRPLRSGKREGVWLEPQLGRETFLVKVDWVDDWPVFNEGKNISLLTRGHGPYPQSSPTTTEGSSVWKEDLKRNDLDLGWYQKHTPLKQLYSLTERPGYLRLWGNCYDLSSPEAPAMLLRKQTAYFQTFEATMEFSPSRTGYEAGIVLWWNQFSHATIGVTLVASTSGDSARTVITRNATEQAGMLKTKYPLSPREDDSPDEMDEAIRPQPCRLIVTCRGSKYVLALEQSGVELAQITCSSEDLTVLPPVGGAFAGVMYGVYAFGSSEAVLDPADFTAISVVSENRDSG